MSVKDLPDAGTVAAQAEAVLREAHALGAAMDRAKTTRRVVFLVLLAFVVIIGVMAYRWVTGLTSPANIAKYQSTASRTLEKNQDEYMRHVTTLVNNVRPHVEKVITEQVRKDAPAYMQAMQGESDKFASNMEVQLRDKLEAFHKKAVEKNMSLVEKEFPAAQDPKVQERLVANIQMAIEELAKKHYVDKMRVAMQNLYQSWDEIPAAKEPAAGAESVEDQMIGALMELLRIRLTKPGGAIQLGGG